MESVSTREAICRDRAEKKIGDENKVKCKIDLPFITRALSCYAAERRLGFENHQAGGRRLPEERENNIRKLLIGVAEVTDSMDPEMLVDQFNYWLVRAQGCAAVQTLPPADQRSMVKNLRACVYLLERQEYDLRPEMLAVKELYEDMTVYLPWDAKSIGLYPAREEVEHALVHATARQPICFMRVLFGGETGPNAESYEAGVVMDMDVLRGLDVLKRLCRENPETGNWPVICTAYTCGKAEDDDYLEASEMDLQIIRETGTRFLSEKGVRWAGGPHEFTLSAAPEPAMRMQ